MAITRKFQIEVLKDRRIVEQVSVFEEGADGKKHRVVQTTERIVPESFMCYFPGGHSIWVEHKHELARLNLVPDENIEIDTDTGLPVLPPVQNNVKAIVARRTVNREAV